MHEYIVLGVTGTLMIEMIIFGLWVAVRSWRDEIVDEVTSDVRHQQYYPLEERIKKIEGIFEAHRKWTEGKGRKRKIIR